MVRVPLSTLYTVSQELYWASLELCLWWLLSEVGSAYRALGHSLIPGLDTGGMEYVLAFVYHRERLRITAPVWRQYSGSIDRVWMGSRRDRANHNFRKAEWDVPFAERFQADGADAVRAFADHFMSYLQDI